MANRRGRGDDTLGPAQLLIGPVRRDGMRGRRFPGTPGLGRVARRTAEAAGPGIAPRTLGQGGGCGERAPERQRGRPSECK